MSNSRNSSLRTDDSDQESFVGSERDNLDIPTMLPHDLSTEKLQDMVMEELGSNCCALIWAIIFMVAASVATCAGIWLLHEGLFQKYFAIMGACFLVCVIFSYVKLYRDFFLIGLRDHAGLPVSGATFLSHHPGWWFTMILMAFFGLAALGFGIYWEIDETKEDPLSTRLFALLSICFLIFSSYHLAEMLRDLFEIQVWEDEFLGGAWPAASALANEMAAHSALRNQMIHQDQGSHSLGQMKTLEHQAHHTVPPPFLMAATLNAIHAARHPLQFLQVCMFASILFPCCVIFYEVMKFGFVPLILMVLGTALLLLGLAWLLRYPKYNCVCSLLGIIIGVICVAISCFIMWAEMKTTHTWSIMGVIVAVASAASGIFGAARSEYRMRMLSYLEWVHREHFHSIANPVGGFQTSTAKGSDGFKFVFSLYHMDDVPDWYHNKANMDDRPASWLSTC